MRSSLDDCSMLDHEDLISMLHGLETMSDDDDGLPFEEAIECLRDELFAL